VVSRDTSHAQSVQEYEEENITLQTVKEHLILLLMQISKFTTLPDHQVLQIPSKTHSNVGAKLKARIKLRKVNLNTVQKNVFLFSVINKQLKRFTFSCPQAFKPQTFRMEITCERCRKRNI